MNPRLKKQVISEINITPFTDVILVLLIIFMMVTPLILQSAIQVKLPEAKASEEPPRTIVVAINRQGEAFLEDSKYSLKFDLGIFKHKLSAAIKKQGVSSVIINGDRNVPYDYVIKVMDTLSQLEVRHILLGVQQEK